MVWIIGVLLVCSRYGRAIYGTSLINGVSAYFEVWAPYVRELSVKLHGRGVFKAERDDRGYFRLELDGVKEGSYIVFLLMVRRSLILLRSINR
ncbi:MAG: hypothetical protein QXE01_02225 [Sulfolobales archaeon]